MCREAHPFVVYYICIDLNYDFICCRRAVNVFIILELRFSSGSLVKGRRSFLFPEVFSIFALRYIFLEEGNLDR